MDGGCFHEQCGQTPRVPERTLILEDVVLPVISSETERICGTRDSWLDKDSDRRLLLQDTQGLLQADAAGCFEQHSIACS